MADALGAKGFVLNTADLPTRVPMYQRIEVAKSLADFDEVVVVSAIEDFNVAGFLATVTRLLPPGPRFFPREMATDQSLEVMLAEFIREKVLTRTRDEVKHAVGVAIEDVSIEEKKDMTTD